MADTPPTPTDALRDEIAMHVQMTVALGPEETLSRIMDTIAGYTRAALSPKVGADDEALIANYRVATMTFAYAERGNDQLENVNLNCTEKALRRRIAGLRAELATVREVLKETEGYERQANARAEAAERELAACRDKAFPDDNQEIVRIARDAAEANGAPSWDRLGEFTRQVYLMVTRTVIRALKTKEPTNG